MYVYVICEKQRQGHQGHSACNDDDEKGQKKKADKRKCNGWVFTTYNVKEDIFGIFFCTIFS